MTFPTHSQTQTALQSRASSVSCVDQKQRATFIPAACNFKRGGAVIPACSPPSQPLVHEQRLKIKQKLPGVCTPTPWSKNGAKNPSSASHTRTLCLLIMTVQSHLKIVVTPFSLVTSKHGEVLSTRACDFRPLDVCYHCSICRRYF